MTRGAAMTRYWATLPLFLAQHGGLEQVVLATDHDQSMQKHDEEYKSLQGKFDEITAIMIAAKVLPRTVTEEVIHPQIKKRDEIIHRLQQDAARLAHTVKVEIECRYASMFSDMATYKAKMEADEHYQFAEAFLEKWKP